MRSAEAPLAEVLGAWHEFYSMLGTASATLVGLLFVAASVGLRAFTSGRPAAQRVFLSASVVHFSSVLAGSLVALLPLGSWRVFGGLILACGLFGLAYSGLTWRDTIRDGLNSAIDLEDRTWYLLLPFIAYCTETLTGIALVVRWEPAMAGLAPSLTMLLIIGIHNAWDITIWSISRTRE